jgi:Ca2+-binding RTX toxin-like protein
MPNQDTDRNTQWTIEQDDLVWTLARRATITVEGQDGIAENGFSGSTIKVLGDIAVAGLGDAGVRFNGEDSILAVGADAHIDAKEATYGIRTDGASADIVNHGLIVGGYAGIYGTAWSNIDNYGTVRGEKGIVFIDNGSRIHNHGTIKAIEDGIMSDAFGTVIENGRHALIGAGDRAIYLEGPGMATINNDGILRGGSYAIYDGYGTLNVTNNGVMIGDVVMGAGSDTFDNRRGELKGRVFGGEGNDDFFVGRDGMEIIEDDGANSGYDEVRTNISFTLPDNIEQLGLLGRRGISGKGNAADNLMIGNEGNNRLNGGAGNDVIAGMRGDDVLTGQIGNDIFEFLIIGTGVDRVTDYDDGADRISIDSVNTEEALNALKITQVRDDVVIDLGDGNRIILEHTYKADLDFNDFYVG